ncbi:MtnX-like HAD-IB family phosphatase (plasmid) [Bartonella sp. HY329]|uniref:MtnX-like HAD-IB family phosphatase n=1 Tax=unclassified Bartonella TaxID=2645622 RepID=UPI0021C6C1BA|nr:MULTISPECIES: MtnX-like HAD-IB family phosphatase [unclassified Bartonella]UXM96497.1 MtnX-like HAD-IB family phosphatase [Bartonella sp. HY329]UXN10820.1 MtnX-like HAD-IB family phosphatase [Bartonella sp. HY328]
MYKQNRNFSPLAVNSFSMTNIDTIKLNGRTTVLIDFDGTICYQDVTDLLLNKFALPGFEELENLWLSGAIGARECMEKQVALIRATPQQLDGALNEAQIDMAFKPFLDMIKRQGATAQIVSDGLDYSINHILAHSGIKDLPVYSNHLVHLGGEKWKLEFPFKANNCPSGHCKCRRYDQLPLSPFGKTIYIGDGTSDFCPSQKADFVLAKGKLADYCEKHAIAHMRVKDFAQIMALWPDLMMEMSNTHSNDVGAHSFTEQRAARIAS